MREAAKKAGSGEADLDGLSVEEGAGERRLIDRPVIDRPVIDRPVIDRP